MKAKKIILLYFMLLSCSGYSQYSTERFNGWRLTSLSGEAKIKGQYREYEIISYGISELQKSSHLSGGAQVNTKSFILHPNFLLLDADAGYFPETSRDNYIVFPDQSDVRTVKKLGFRTTLFPKKKITLFTFANFNDSYQNRENLTDIKSNSKHWGGTLVYRNKFLPLSAGFRQGRLRQEEIATGRKFNMDERVFHAETNRSFGSGDRNELTYSHNESVNQDIIPGKDANSYLVKNSIDDIHLNNNIPVDKKKKYLFNSTISDYNYRGNRNFNRVQALEGITMRLPENFTFSNSYNLNWTRQELNKSNSHGIQSALTHKLYLSLDSRLFFDYNLLNHTAYRENVNKTGIDFHYTKKIPTRGRLTLSYTFFRLHKNVNSAPSYLQVTNEVYTLTDGQMVLFKRPYVIKESVVVRDAMGAITYQLNMDYILVDKDPYLEIVRIPGGMIANNADVYIDYTATQPGSYKYDTDNHSFSANISLFNRKLEVYYGISAQDNKNLDKTEFQVLNYYNQNFIGGRLDFGFINGGAEYTDYKSTLIPHRKTRYYISVQQNYRGKIFFTLNGNTQDYYMIKENIYQKYSDVTGKIACPVFKQTSLSFDLMYRNQSGPGIDLDLLTAKSEITSVVRQLYITAGVEMYRRNYVGEKVNFKGVYIQLSRRF